MPEQNKTLKYASYSTLKSYKDCGHYVKITKVERIKDRHTTVKTHFGTLLHEGVQSVLTGTPVKEALRKYIRTGVRYGKFWRKYIDFEKNNLTEIMLAGKYIIQNIQQYLEEKFGKFEVLAVEEKLEVVLDHPQIFIGYIDLVIKTEDEVVHIIDIKTCDSTFFFNKYRDRFKDYQITLYKHFYSEKHEIDKKKIKTHFLLFERNPKSKTIMTLLPVSSGKVKIHNALTWINNQLTAINKGVFLKNRDHCNAFGRRCSFWDTEHCPINK